MNGYHLFLLVLAVVIVAPVLGFWRITVINGRIRRGETL